MSRQAVLRFGFLLSGLLLPASAPAEEPPALSTLVWLCPDHRRHPEDAPGSCAVCGRPLVQKRLASVQSCPMHPMEAAVKGGSCPQCGMAFASATVELEWFCEDAAGQTYLEPGVCAADGRARRLRRLPMPHGDHNPRHGGLLFMAADGFHHLEGALSDGGTFRLFLYDDFTRPLPAGSFAAREADRPLAVSPDGRCLEVTLPHGAGVPVEITAFVRFPGGSGEERFDFVFDEPAAALPVSMVKALTASSDPSALFGAIQDRARKVDDLVRRGAWPDLYIPALEAKDLALLLLAREGEAVALPVKTLVRAAWLLDLYGDLGKKAEVEAAHRLFARGMAQLAEARAR